MKIKQILLNGMLLFFVLGSLSAQDSVKTKKRDKPVRFPWDSEVLIDNQTTLSSEAKTLELFIQHRFGLANANGIHDLFGIYAPGANIRIGLDYTVVKNLTLGYGITKKNMYNDFHAKWILLEQTRANKIPVAITLYGDVAIDGRKEDVFGTQYKFSNRFSYFSQLIVSRKVTDWLSIEATGSFTHYNSVDSTMNHDVIGVGINGQIKFSPQSSIIFQYDIPLKIQGISEQPAFTDHNAAKPNFGIGYQDETSSHSFQIYITTANGILPQDIYMYNRNDWKSGGIMFGFTITRLWNF